MQAEKAMAVRHGLSSLSSESAERIVRRLKRDAPEIAAALARIMKMPPQITLRRHRARSTNRLCV
jgi:hypothetical protein